jgi:hypothetical protein
MKIEISPWSHVKTSFLVPEGRIPPPPSPSSIIIPNNSNNNNDADECDDDSGIHKVIIKSGHPKSLRKGQTSQETVPVVEDSFHHTHDDDISFGFIEHTKSSLSYYNHHSKYNNNISNSSRKRRKVSSHSKRYLRNSADEELQEDRIPVLTVSTPNHIAVMVDGPRQKRIQESAILQFHHHHPLGSTVHRTPTLPSTATSTATTTSRHTIPPIYDIHNHCMYAVQCNNTKIICHYNNTAISKESTTTDENGHTPKPLFRHPNTPQMCEVTFPCEIQSLSILYLPETKHHNHSKKSKSTVVLPPRSILYGTCSNSQLFMLWTQPVVTTTTTTTNGHVHSTTPPSTLPPNALQLVIQYLDTPYTTTAASVNQAMTATAHVRTTKTNLQHPPLPSKSSHNGNDTDQQHAGTLAVVCHPVPTQTASERSSNNNNKSGAVSGTKKRSLDALTTEQTSMTHATPSDCTIVCFYQIFYTRRNTVQLVRQHVRFLHEPPLLSVSSTTTGMYHTPQSMPTTMTTLSTNCSLYSDQQHTNAVTPIPIRNQCPIEDLKVLGTTDTPGIVDSEDNNNNVTIVLSYRSLRHGSNTAHTSTTHHEMNGGSSKPIHSASTMSAPRYDSFYMTLSTSSRRVMLSSVSSFPFVLPYTDDAIQHVCLVGPSMIGVLTQRYQQIYLYDLHRGGLMHVAQPFPTSTKSTGNISMTCISLLADMKRSKMAVTYISAENPKKYCLAYASFGVHNTHHSNHGPISLADGLTAASSSAMSIGIPFHSMSQTRTLFLDVSKWNDNYQNESILPQQTAIQNSTFLVVTVATIPSWIVSIHLNYHSSFFVVVAAVQMLYEMCEKIKRADIETTEPSFVLKTFDAAMQSMSAHGGSNQRETKDTGKIENGKTVPTNGIKSRNLGDSLPLKDVKKNGGKVVNGFHKKSEFVSPTTVKDQLYNGSENHHQSEGMNHSLQTRPKKSHYQLSEMPQVLIDAATGSMLAILCMNFPDVTTALSIRNDARVLLRRLIRSGKVSARSQFNCIPTGSSPTDTDAGAASRFMQLLHSVELSRAEKCVRDEVWSAYTPFDLICDMFEHCTDISERQMVVALRYTFFNTRPIDIASYFVRNKNMIGTGNLRKLGSDLMLAWKQQNDVSQAHKSNVAKWTLLQHKIVVAGTAFLIYRITKSSVGFNVALLRNAFEAEFDMAEFEVLMRLMLEMLSNPDKFHLPVSSNMSMKNLLQLIVTLCDCLPTFKSESGTVDVGTLPRMERLLSMLTGATGRILSMQKLLQESIDSISRNTAVSTGRQTESMEPASNVLDRPKPTPKPTAALPPYQIERLLF